MLKLKNYSLIISKFEDSKNIAEQVLKVITFVQNDKHIKNFFKSKINYKSKKEIIDHIFASFNIKDDVKHILYDIFIKYIKYIKYIQIQIDNFLRKKLNIKNIIITAPYSMHEDEVKSIKEKFGINNHYSIKNNPSILFGLIFQIDNTLYNYSACEDLKKIK